MIRQHCFTEKCLGQNLKYVKTSNFPDCYKYMVFLDVSGMQRVCTKFMDINYSSGMRIGNADNNLTVHCEFMYEKHHEQIYIYI